MTGIEKRFGCNAGIFFSTVLLFLGSLACTSSKSSKAELKKDENQKAGSAKNRVYKFVDLNCAMEHIQNPPESFHYSYHKQSSNPVEEDADITPQTIDGSFKNSSATNPIHGVRSDAESWRKAWSGLMGISGMSSAIAIIRGSSATSPAGDEKVNGYQTTKYLIDTTRADPMEQGLYRTVLGAGGFEKGTAWATEDGCPVKLIMDSELHGNDGSIEKIHYEIAMVRK